MGDIVLQLRRAALPGTHRNKLDTLAADKIEHLDRQCEFLHTAICQAVTILNTAPGVVYSLEGRQAYEILRKALADFVEV